MLCQNFKAQTHPINLTVKHPTYSSMSKNAPLHTTMQDNEISLDDLVKTLADNFNVLADEVQLLSDRKTILEHKLRFAHEQVR
jgi:hypothetical protein